VVSLHGEVVLVGRHGSWSVGWSGGTECVFALLARECCVVGSFLLFLRGGCCSLG
jgi:hypothetical protein